MIDDDDEVLPKATRRQARRIASNRRVRHGLRMSGNRAMLRWWARVVPLWGPVIHPKQEHEDRPRRYRRRPTRRD